MKCSVCGSEIGGRGDHCPNNGEKWHNKVHKQRYQRKHWGGPLKYWDPLYWYASPFGAPEGFSSRGEDLHGAFKMFDDIWRKQQ